MLHSLAARTLIMMKDYRLTYAEAVGWVTRRLPANMRRYYRGVIAGTIAGEVYNV